MGVAPPQRLFPWKMPAARCGVLHCGQGVPGNSAMKDSQADVEVLSTSDITTVESPNHKSHVCETTKNPKMATMMIPITSATMISVRLRLFESPLLGEASTFQSCDPSFTVCSFEFQRINRRGGSDEPFR
jgi:hypothetical protein